MNKAIYYFSLAANQGNREAQFNLGIFYYLRDNNLDVKKGRYYIMLSSKNGNKQANFSQGFMHHEGKNLERNIQEAILFYKEASSFNNQYAKNNLGVIYKNGFEDKIKKQSANAVIFFEEAIRQKKDYLSMYNLAHIYLYDDTIKRDIDKSIKLLIKSAPVFWHSMILLCIALVKKNSFNIERIKQEVEEVHEITKDLSNKIIQLIYQLKLLDGKEFEISYETYRTLDFLYNIALEAIPTSSLLNIKKYDTIPKYPNAKEITSLFYEGFDLDI